MPKDSSFSLRLNAESVRNFILSRGGKVYNTELVKHFKPLLVQPETKDVAREEFKKIINNIAVVLRDEKDEKYLILKRHSNDQSPVTTPEPSLSYSCSFSSLLPSIPQSPSMDSLSSIPSASKQPPPYRSPPPVVPSQVIRSPNACSSSTLSESSVDKAPPPVPPRRRSSDKIKLDNKENEIDDTSKRLSVVSDESENKVGDEQKISVKERTQRFNRLASTEESRPVTKTQQSSVTSAACKKRFDKVAFSDRDEDDCVSVTSFDPRSKEWLVRSAQADYQALAKMCAENPKLARLKDPSTGTALHWGAKHGNMDIVKLIAGTCKIDANIRTGYTPLHIAAQFNRDDVYDLLTKVYGADPNLRDWSGRKPEHYKNNSVRNISRQKDAIRKTKSQKKHSEKDSSFLRIGSLNVRVKRTTEAVSNFLGVSQSNLDKAHKTWGSADSIQDCKKMPPPSTIPTKKRKPKQLKESISETKFEEKSDSDSDSAVGFGARWKQTV